MRRIVSSAAVAVMTAAVLVVGPQAQADHRGPPRTKADCRNGGWMHYRNPSFRNQGQCIRFVQTGKAPNPGRGRTARR